MEEKYQHNFIHAGSLAKEVRSFGKSLIKKGASYNETIRKINEKIISLGARAAFPPQIALNDVAAHFLPQPEEDIFFNDEMIKLDVGVCYRGAIGDCAVTVDLSGTHQKLIEAVEMALSLAEKKIKVGLPIREIGKTIEETIVSQGFQPVRNLSGHGLGFYLVHTPPVIPNYDNYSKEIIKPGMTFAIEPFATTGEGVIFERGIPTIYSQLPKKTLPPTLNPSIAMTIKSFKGLPFCLHDLLKEECSLMEARSSLAELLIAGCIAGYAPLIEETRGFVAQAENSILVDPKGEVFITTG